eukprot:359718-Chlamydomonas_euryale.AAC.13
MAAARVAGGVGPGCWQQLAWLLKAAVLGDGGSYLGCWPLSRPLGAEAVQAQLTGERDCCKQPPPDIKDWALYNSSTTAGQQQRSGAGAKCLHHVVCAVVGQHQVPNVQRVVVYCPARMGKHSQHITSNTSCVGLRPTALSSTNRLHPYVRTPKQLDPCCIGKLHEGGGDAASSPTRAEHSDGGLRTA